ncbi:MAG TPA: primary-amine oxidase [Methylomirabilota bacterium]|nr:primary-amine oxidase [Methylomirabilota bacterium]
MTTTAAATTRTAHPLDPLTADEIDRAWEILRTQQTLSARTRVVSITLHEPPKEVVLGHRSGDAGERAAFVVVMDSAAARTYEAVVSLSRKQVVSWEHIPGVQPAIVFDEFFECEAAVRADPRWQEAMRKRGVTDFSLAMVDPWSAGHFGLPDEDGRRLSRTLTWIRRSPTDNGYARPIANLIAVVDLNAMKVLSVEDYGVVPLPPEDANYSPDVAGTRTDLKPIEIRQPEGPSFELDGHELAWQKWRMRLSFTPREGLVLHTVTYRDQGRERPILYRASVVDMVVPYGDPRPTYFHRNAFDIGEYGIGYLANSLENGCDCLGEIRYLDAVVNDSRGGALTLRNAICLHEEDYGILWKHLDWRTGYTEVRRSRRLVVSFIATVGNYEYGFYWYFYQDGTIQLEVKLTGIVSNGAVRPGEKPRWGELVAPQVYGPIHQHFFNARLDMMVDGLANSVYEVDTVADAPGPENPHHNAFHTEATLLGSELEAQRIIDPLAGRFWKVVNPSVRNRLGEPVGYKLVPGENVLPFAGSAASVIRRAGFTTRHLWVTRFDPRERYAAGDYPNQHPGGAGLPSYAQDDASLENTDVVVWYTFGAHHVVRPEDWPVMPVAYIGFALKPVGFFDKNPALDVPRPTPPATCGHAGPSGHGD